MLGTCLGHKPAVLSQLSPGARLPARVYPPSAEDPGLFCSAGANANQLFWLILVSTEEEKLVLEKSVRHSSKVRGFGFLILNKSKPELSWN